MKNTLESYTAQLRAKDAENKKLKAPCGGEGIAEAAAKKMAAAMRSAWTPPRRGRRATGKSSERAGEKQRPGARVEARRDDGCGREYYRVIFVAPASSFSFIATRRLV